MTSGFYSDLWQINCQLLINFATGKQVLLLCRNQQKKRKFTMV